jgi:chloramphenicol 3-O-phosphotransferase
MAGDGATGRIVFVTGPSGVGKTTVCRLLRGLLGGGWLFWEADSCQPLLTAVVDERTAAGLEMAMTRANLGAIRSYAAAGFDVLAELAVSFPERAAAVAEHLGDLDVAVVLLIADREAVLARIGQRSGSTDPGWAARYFDACDWSASPSDFMVDTTDLAPADIAAFVASELAV